MKSQPRASHRIRSASTLLIGCSAVLFAAAPAMAIDAAPGTAAPTARAQGPCEGKCTFEDVLQNITSKLHAARLQDDAAPVADAAATQPPASAEQRPAKRRRAAKYKPTIQNDGDRREQVADAVRPRLWKSAGWAVWRPRFAAAAPARKSAAAPQRRVQYAALWPAARAIVAAPARPAAVAPVPVVRPKNLPTAAKPAPSAVPAPTVIKAKAEARPAKAQAASPFGGLDIH